MKTIGILSAMRWESTLEYYKLINEEMQNRLGGVHSAKIVLSNIDFEEVCQLESKNDWNKLAEVLCAEAHNIQNAGADFLIICTNTLPKIINKLEENISIPILDMMQTTAQKIKSDGISKVALLGSESMMNKEFYQHQLSEKLGIDVFIPNEQEQKLIITVMKEELYKGLLKRDSRNEFIKIINRLETQHKVEGVIFGCSEISNLIKKGYVKIPIYDTSKVHISNIIDHALDVDE